MCVHSAEYATTAMTIERNVKRKRLIKMASKRSMWSGSMGIGLINVPIKLHSMGSGEGVKFHYLAPDGSPIEYKKVSKKDGSPVEFKDIKMGYEIAPGAYVVLTKEEIDAVKPSSDKLVKIDRFVQLGDVNPIYFGNTYLISPAKGGEEAYSLMYAALAKTRKAGVGRITMRSKEYPALIRAEEGGMVLTTMVHADEIVLPKDIGVEMAEPRGDAVNLAISIIDSLSGDFNLADYPDDYRARLKAVIAQKAAGATVTLEAAKPAAATKGDALVGALEATLAQFKKVEAAAKKVEVAPLMESPKVI